MIDRSDSQLVEICLGGCPHFHGSSGECGVVAVGVLRPLAEGTPCDVPRFVEQFAKKLLRSRSSVLERFSSEVTQEALLPLARTDSNVFPRDRPPNIVNLRAWLATVTANAVVAVLRREGIAVRVRCGACVRFAADRGCLLDVLASGERNPHLGHAVVAASDPRKLVPRCPEFVWRHRAVSFDVLLESERAAAATDRRNDPAAAAEREDDGRVVLRALAELAAEGPDGFRRALVLRRIYLDGQSAKAIAHDLALSERTVKRDRSQGLRRLRAILDRLEGAHATDETAARRGNEVSRKDDPGPIPQAEGTRRRDGP